MHAAIISSTCVPFVAFVKLGLTVTRCTGIRHIPNTLARRSNVLPNLPIPLRRPGPNLNRLPKHIAKTLIQSTAFIRIYQIRRVGRHRMRNFMTTNIQRRQRRKRCSITIAIGHHTAIPKRIVVITAVVDITQNLRAIVIETVSTMLPIEIIISHLRPPMRIRCHLVLRRIHIVPGRIRICKIYRRAVVCPLLHIIGLDALTPTGFPEAI